MFKSLYLVFIGSANLLACASSPRRSAAGSRSPERRVDEPRVALVVGPAVTQ